MFYVLLCFQLYLICPLLLFSTNSNEIRLEAAIVDEPMRLSQSPQIILSIWFIESCFTLEYIHIKVRCVVKQISFAGKAKEF